MIIQSLVEHKRKNSLLLHLAKLAISKDRTLRQPVAQKKAKAEMQRRIAEGDLGLKIVMKRGMPIIIKRQQNLQNVAEKNTLY